MYVGDKNLYWKVPIYSMFINFLNWNGIKLKKKANNLNWINYKKIYVDLFISMQFLSKIIFCMLSTSVREKCEKRWLSLEPKVRKRRISKIKTRKFPQLTASAQLIWFPIFPIRCALKKVTNKIFSFVMIILKNQKKLWVDQNIIFLIKLRWNHWNSK